MSFAALLLFGCGQSATDAQPVKEVVSITPEIEPKKIKGKSKEKYAHRKSNENRIKCVIWFCNCVL